MSRFFVSSVAVGAAAKAANVDHGRPVFAPTVSARSTVTGASPGEPVMLSGPSLQLLGPGDVLGLDATAITRVEPAAGCVNGIANYLALIEFADAALPWAFSLPQSAVPTPAGPQRRPWLALIVLRDDEGDLIDGDPLPVIDAPATALPDLRHSWAWAHVEARVDGGDPLTAIAADLRTGLDSVVSRLICPRKLDPDRAWLACVVPATKGGREAGLGGDGRTADADVDAWVSGEGKRLPVYYSWRFRTGAAGSFEELARKVHPVKGKELPGFGTRTVDVRHPWPHVDVLAGAPETLTVQIQGALRLPDTQTDEESWSDEPAMREFHKHLKTQLDAPAARRTSANIDRDENAVAPPLYGSHHTGVQTVPGDGVRPGRLMCMHLSCHRRNLGGLSTPQALSTWPVVAKSSLQQPDGGGLQNTERNALHADSHRATVRRS